MVACNLSTGKSTVSAVYFSISSIEAGKSCARSTPKTISSGKAQWHTRNVASTAWERLLACTATARSCTLGDAMLKAPMYRCPAKKGSRPSVVYRTFMPAGNLAPSLPPTKRLTTLGCEKAPPAGEITGDSSLQSSGLTRPSRAKLPAGAGPKPARSSARAAELCELRSASDSARPPSPSPSLAPFSNNACTASGDPQRLA
mmetsp:Transcript_69114/g.164677  ORF Transcript_69114/g.164677 Transcript_69114/m.164677 type:complete len:201 (-) Transcript_69114:236-838(-)